MTTATHPPAAHLLPSSAGQKYLTLTLCFVVALLEGLDLQSAGIAASGLRAEFHLLPSQMGSMFSAGLIGTLPSALVGGWLSDRIGCKRVLIGAVLMFGLFSLATAYVWDYESLLAARFLAGLGLGATLPILILMAMAADPNSTQSRSFAVSTIYAGVPFGGILASVLGIMNFGGGWRGLFYVGGLLPLAIIVLLVLWLPDMRPVREVRSLTKPNVEKANSSLLGLFKDGLWKPTLLLWLAFFFVMTVLYMLLNWLPSLMQGKGISRADTGLVQIMFSFGAGLGTLSLGWLMDRARRMPGVVAVHLGMLLSLAGLGLSSNFAWTLLAGFGSGYCAAGCQLVLYALAPTLYPASIRGTGVGALITVGRLGAISGPFITGQILLAGLGLAGVMTAASPGIAVAAVAAVVLLSAQRASNTKT